MSQPSKDLDALFRDLPSGPDPDAEALALPDAGQVLGPSPESEPIPITPVKGAAGGYLVVKLDLRARAWLVAPPDQFLSDMSEGELVPMLESLRFGDFTELVGQLVTRLASCFGDAAAAWRRRALIMAARVIREAGPAVSELMMDRASRPLVKLLQNETDAEAAAALGEAVCAFGETALKAGRLTSFADLLRNGLRRKTGRDRPTQLVQVGMFARLQSLARVATPNPVIEAIKAGPEEIRQGAVIIAGVMGPGLVPDLIGLICGSESMEVRVAAAKALREIGTGQAELAARVAKESEPLVARRALEVLELSGEGSVSAAVHRGLDHPDAEVRVAAFKVVRRVDKPVAVATLRPLLAGTDPAKVDGALVAIKDLGLSELGSEVARRLEGATEEEELRKLLEVLLAAPSTAALPALRKIVQSKRMLGLRPQYPDAVRALAVQIAAKLNHPTAKEILELALDDRSETVRRAVRR